MSPDQVEGALGGAAASHQKRVPWGNTTTAIDEFTGVGLRGSYADCERLAGISVDAMGPFYVLTSGAGC